MRTAPTPPKIYMEMTPVEAALVERLQADTGVRSRTELVRMALRELARQRKVPLKAPASGSGSEAA